MLKISSGFSQHLWPSLVPLVPVLLQPSESDSQLGFEKFPQVTGQFCGTGVTGTLGIRRAFAVSARSSALQSSGRSPTVMQEDLCSAPWKGSAQLAKRGHCFIFRGFFNHRKCCMFDDLWLSLEKQKGSKLSLFQKVKLLSYVSKKPITSSRPTSTLYIYSLEMLYLPTISHLNHTENTRPVCTEGNVNCSRQFLRYLTTTWLVSKALAHLPACVCEG